MDTNKIHQPFIIGFLGHLNEIELCATKAAIICGRRLLSVESMDAILASSPSLEDYFLAQIAKRAEME